MNTAPRPSRPGGTRDLAATPHLAEDIAVRLPLLGEVQLPRPEQLAYYAGIGVLVALELIEWPTALVLGVGHALVTQDHNQTIKEFGEALELAGIETAMDPRDEVVESRRGQRPVVTAIALRGVRDIAITVIGAAAAAATALAGALPGAAVGALLGAARGLTARSPIRRESAQFPPE